MEKVKTVIHRIKKERSAYLFILPTFLFFIFFLFKPIIDGIRLSFYDVGLTDKTWCGFKNYLNLLNDKIFYMQIKNTFIIASLLIPLLILISLLISLVLVRLNNFLRSFYRAAFYLPAVSSGVVITMVWLWIFNPNYGLLNYLLSIVGIQPIIWLGEANPARISVVIVVFTWIIGTNIILYISSLLAIPQSIYDASDIDGVNSWQKFIYITLPLISPTTLFLLVTNTIGAFQIWEAVYLLTKGGPSYATTTFVYRIYQLGFRYFKFGLASAHAVILLIIIFLISFFQFKYLSKQLEY